MRILITGNLGYVGPVVVRHLRRTHPQAELVGVDAGFFAHCLTTSSAIPERYITTQHFADVRDLTSDLFTGIDSVVHLAAISNDPMGNVYEGVTGDINWRASVRAAELAKRAGVKTFVVASSCSVYGSADSQPRGEAAGTNPLTAYARSKLAMERSLEGLANEEFRVTCLRFPTACGMSERLRLDLVLNDFVASALVTGTIRILSDGAPWRPVIDVEDMALAFEWAVSRELHVGGAFLTVNVGRDDSNYQVRDLASAVQAVLPDVALEVNPTAPTDSRSYQVDFTRFRSLAPAYVPRKSLTETIMGVKDGLTAIEFSDPEFRDSSFVRLRVLSELRRSGYLDEDLRWTMKNGARWLR